MSATCHLLRQNYVSSVDCNLSSVTNALHVSRDSLDELVCSFFVTEKVLRGEFYTVRLTNEECTK